MQRVRLRHLTGLGGSRFCRPPAARIVEIDAEIDLLHAEETHGTEKQPCKMAHLPDLLPRCIGFIDRSRRDAESILRMVDRRRLRKGADRVLRHATLNTVAHLDTPHIVPAIGVA